MNVAELSRYENGINDRPIHQLNFGNNFIGAECLLRFTAEDFVDFALNFPDRPDRKRTVRFFFDQKRTEQIDRNP
jgi:hypothetical protein